MKHLKPILNRIPELYFIVVAIYYWFDVSYKINYISIAIIGIALVLLFFKVRPLGIGFSVLMLLVSNYILLAWFSDFVKVELFSGAFYKYIKGLILFILPNIVMATVMLLNFIGFDFKTLKIKNAPTKG